MNILLLSMPDSFEHMPSIVVRMPNGALTSLAGNVHPRHRVFVADLILAQRNVRTTLERLFKEVSPTIVGLSVMTFQRKTAYRVIRLVREMLPRAHVVAGGYDPSLDTAAFTDPGYEPADFIVRSEGERTFSELVEAIEAGDGFDHISGLSYRKNDEYIHNPDRPVLHLDRENLRLPDRKTRALRGYTMMGKQVDVIETSRGCTYDCSFCSIVEMRGRNFHTFSIERVIDDIRDARDNGAGAVFITDDNIMLNVQRFEDLCRAIIDAGLHTIDYSVQAMTSSIANHGGELAPIMRRAGFRYVFLGIENVLDDDLAFLRAKAKNTRRHRGQKLGNASLEAVNLLHRHGMYVIGGLIVGNPGDTKESVEANLDFARRYVDWPYIQHPTPYPRTPMTRSFREQNLIVNDRVESYDGTTAVVRTRHLSAEDVEFLRWKAERWIKVKHVPAAFRYNPLFTLRYAPAMLRFTFRGCTVKTFLGLENEREAFDRYKKIRESERNYL